MKVTDVKIVLIKNSQKYGAHVRVTLDDSLVLTGLRVIKGAVGDFMVYPNDPHHEGNFYLHSIFPKSYKLYEHIENEVMEAYKKELDK